MIPPKETEHQGLPESYTNVHVVALNTATVSTTPSNITPLQGNVGVEDAKQQEANRLNHASSKLGNIDISAEDAIAWAAYHSGKQQDTNDPPALTALLPLFYEKADSPCHY